MRRSQKQCREFARPSHFHNADISRWLTERPCKNQQGAEQSRRKRRGNTHGFLRKCQPPACPRNPVATKDRSGRAQCQAKKTGIKKHVISWKIARQSKKGDHLQLGEDHSAELNNVKAASAIAWQISPFCQQQMWRSHVLDGTDNMQLSSSPRRYIKEGKTAKVVSVTLSNL